MTDSGPNTTTRIAVVDSDEAILDSFRLLFHETGWSVRTYSSGESFLRALPEHTPDCLILEPCLPDLSGAIVAGTVCTADPNIAIVGLTTRPGSPLANDVVRAGARIMLTKPVPAGILIEQINAALVGR